MANLSCPSGHIVIGGNRIGSDTYNEDVSLPVLLLYILAQVLFSTRVMNLDVDLPFFDFLDVFVDVKNGGLGLFREVVLEVASNEAGFAN